MNVYLRPAELGDLPLMMAWRSSPLVYGGFYTQKQPLDWDEHVAWFKSRNQDWRSFIVLYGGRPVGVVNIGQLDHWNPEIGYFIGEVSLWGKGIGREAVRLGLEYIKSCGKEYCHTTVLQNNARSIKLLKSLGFKYLGKARKGEVWMTKKL